MQYYQFINILRKTPLSSVYLFEGEEQYFQETGLKLLLKKTEITDLNYNVFYGKETNITNIIETLNTPPFMDSKRFILIYDIQNASPSFLTELTKYIENPLDSSCLCLFATKIDKRTSLYKSIEKKGVIIECKPLFENQVSRWLKEYIKSQNKEISLESANLLVEKFSNNLRILTQEIEKLIIYIEDRKTITTEDIEQVCFRIRIENIYKLCNAILNKEKTKMLNYYFDLDNKEPIYILGVISQQFRKLWQVKLLYEQKFNSFEIAKKVNISSFFIQDFIKIMKKISFAQLKEIFGSFLETDRKIKMGLQDPSLALELLIIKICT